MSRLSHVAVPAIVLLLAGASGATPVGASQSAPRLSITSPTLTPRYTLSATDFTVRCGLPVSVSVTAGSGVKVGLGAAAKRSGSFVRTISLKPGQAFRIRVTGRRAYETQTVRCLPDDFPLWSVSRSRTAKPQAQWYIISPDLRAVAGNSLPLTGEPYAAVVNNNGVPVWWMRDPTAPPMDAKLVGRDRIAWSLFGYDLPLRVRSLGGKIVSTARPVNAITDFHEFQVTKDGGYLLIGGRLRDCPATASECVDLSQWGGPQQATVMDNVIQKLDRRGKLLWEWSTRGHIAAVEGARWIPNPSTRPRVFPDGRSVYDIFHINAVAEDRGAVVFSARHLDAAYKVSLRTGAIIWKLGGTARKQSLKVAGNPEGFSGLHDVRILDDGTITLHDNGSFLTRGPRAVRFELRSGVAKLIENVSDARVTFSLCCGSARRMRAGNWVITSGAGSSTVSELSPSGRPLLTLTMPTNLFTYRADAIEPGRLSAAALRAGMDAQAPR